MPALSRSTAASTVGSGTKRFGGMPIPLRIARISKDLSEEFVLLSDSRTEIYNETQLQLNEWQRRPSKAPSLYEAALATEVSGDRIHRLLSHAWIALAIFC
jgi:hypothetical protein